MTIILFSYQIILSIDFCCIFWIGLTVLLISAFCLPYAVHCTFHSHLIPHYLNGKQPLLSLSTYSRHITWILGPVIQFRSVFTLTLKVECLSSWADYIYFTQVLSKTQGWGSSSELLGYPPSPVCILIAEVFISNLLLVNFCCSDS